MTGFMEKLTQDILVTSILMGLIAVVGLVGNLLMLRALAMYARLRTDFYTVFGCLSVVDTLFLLVGVPAHIMEMVLATEITKFWCKSSHYVTNACGFTSASLLVVLAVLRGILLTNRNNRRPKAVHLLISCIVISVVILLCTVPITLVYTSYDGMCDFVDDIGYHVWLISSFSAIVPLGLVVLIYFLTYMLAKRYFPDSYSQREKEKSWLVTYIIIAFTLCQMPYRILSIYELSVVDNAHLEKMFTVKTYLMCLVVADKAIRPILYTKLASDLSESFDEVINCTYCAKHYSMGSRFGRASAVYTTTTTPLEAATPGGSNSADGHLLNNVTKTTSSSSETSATSQTPLTRKDDDLDMAIEILE